MVATGAAVVSQDNDTLTDTTGDGADRRPSQANDIDSNSAVGTGDVAADDQSVRDWRG